MATEYRFVDSAGEKYAAVASSVSKAKKILKDSYPGVVLRPDGQEEVPSQRYDDSPSLGDILKTMKASRKYRRNQKCPCGSGKKVKHCCGSRTKATS
jgi:uncharacterized protein YecA (UPF0149 family)